MLILTRKRGESIVIPAMGVTITAFPVTGRRVRLAIDAPRDVKVLRGEIKNGARDTRREKPNVEGGGR